MPYDNSNSGTLGRNADKKKPNANPKWPDYKGKVSVGGVDYWLSGWIKKPQSGGEAFISLKFTPKEERRPSPAPSTPADDPFPRASQQAPDDDVPF